MHNTENNNALAVTIAELQSLLTWPENWNSYDVFAPYPDAVARAIVWITDLYNHIALLKLQWITPNVTSSADGEVVFGWSYDQRRLTVYVHEQEIDYLQVWSNDTKAKMTDGYIESINDAQQLWQWLLETSPQQHAQEAHNEQEAGS
jgi:hypothetical protein